MLNEFIKEDDENKIDLTEPLLDNKQGDDVENGDGVKSSDNNNVSNKLQQQQQHLSVETTTTDIILSTPQQRRIRALAWSSTTGYIARLLIPILIITTHVLFLYGQTADMWKLTAKYYYNIHYHVKSTETKVVFDAIKIPLSNTYATPKNNNNNAADPLGVVEHNVRTFTYSYAIQELWKAKGMPGLFLPRLAAAGLMLFSGVWPHLKLFMLLLVWFFSKNPIRRKRSLASLSILGKWSLVDVLVVCVMVGVLNLQWDFKTDHVQAGVVQNLSLIVSLIKSMYSATDICTSALHYSCDNPARLDKKAACGVCKTAIHNIYDHPKNAKTIINGIETSGGGHAQLSVQGLHGIYAFCGAVIMSILLSLIVDWYDHKSRTVNNNEEEAHSVTPEITGTLSSDNNNNVLIQEQQQSSTTALLSLPNGDFRSQVDREYDRRILLDSQQTANKYWLIVSSITSIIVALATIMITMERKVHGAMPSILHDILGVVWTKNYSFASLGYTTGLAGGWDIMLLSTFVLFVVAGPLTRAILCLQAALLNETSTMSPTVAATIIRKKRNLSFWIDFIGAFCAWEVFTIAVLMVDLLMPTITNTIIMDKRCAQLSNNDGDSCLEVEFDMRKTFWLVIGGGILLLLVSQRIRRSLLMSYEG